MSRFFISSDEHSAARLEALNSVLRALALAGLGHSLGATPSAPVVVDSDGIALFERLVALRDHADQAPAQKRFDDMFLLNPAPALSPVQRALVSAAFLRAEADTRGAKRKATRAPSGAAPLAMDAEHFLDVWAGSVFGSFAFQAAVARALHDDLAGRVLLWPLDTSPPRLSAVSCWWLAAQAQPANISGAPPKRIAALLNALQIQAERGFAGDHWAGFWDQYLLHRLRIADAPPPGAQISALDDLPLLAHGARALRADPASDSPKMRSDWRAAAPAYAQALFGDGF